MRSWLIQFRGIKGFTQKEVADKSGISRSHYNDIEHGRRNPSPETSEAIASTLGFDSILFFEERRRKTSQNKKRKSA